MGTRSLRRGAVVAGTIGLVVPGILHANAETSAGQLATETLASISGLSPVDFGAATVDGLEYADPTEALAIIDAPEPNNDGSAELSYPLGVPPGHGITPELTVQYGSGGGNGWMGEGWDLGVGEITVDTTFGAPHFDPQKESESYVLDGDLLVPNANDDSWEPRVDGDRHDFSRQVETDYDEIIRHQVVGQLVNTVRPPDYFWEVRAKDGSVRWYGGTPDSGGPVPTGAAPTIDENAVVRNQAGNIVTWLLSAERDIGVNLIRYEYETVEYDFNGTTWVVAGCDPAAELCGQHTYLDRIIYTDATAAIADFNGPPYEIDLVRESEMPGPGGLVRADPIVDAGLGYVDVTVDRLARVEVKHGAEPAAGATRNYDSIAARYDFGYTTGRFGKTLLSTITQGVDDPHTHQIEYFDDLEGVDGFAGDASWSTGDDIEAQLYLDSTADVSALGGSETNSGSGNIYIGFNPISPSKTLSVGVGIELSGGDTDAIAEWIDLNGDNLPDKVFVDGSTVKFRLNNSGPSGPADFTATGNAPGIGELTQNSNFGFQVSAEAYPLVALGLGTGLAFSWTSSYFSDVNGDGLVDFVSGGQVYFNRLVAGVPTFEVSSAGTPIPLAPSPLPDLSSDQLDQITETLALQAPPIDTVRRFVAPFAGTINIAAPVSLGADSVDGARVAIQHNADEIDAATLAASGTAFPNTISRAVAAGDRIYFRAGAAVDVTNADGTNDLLAWSPVITYDEPDPDNPLPTDANGLSQVEYSAASDFTLAGRPNDFIAMPNTGTVQVDASVSIAEPLTDSVTVVAVKRAPDGTDTPYVLGTIANEPDPAVSTGTFTYSTAASPIPVQLHETTVDGETNIEADLLSVYLAVDSPVDLGDIDFSATITYATAEDDTGAAIPVVDSQGAPIFEHLVRPHVEIYPNSYPAAPAAQVDLTGNPDVLVAVKAPTRPDGMSTVNAVITVKSADGLVQKVETPLTVLPDGTAFTPTKVSLGDLSAGPAAKWVEVSIRDNTFGRDGLVLQKFVTVDGAAAETTVQNVSLRWSGMQGIFPQSYRGWGVAGYTAGGNLGSAAMAESAFVIDPDSYPQEEPTREDASLDEAHTEPSYAYVPVVASSTGGTTADPVGTDRWLGPWEHLYGDAADVQTSRLGLDSVDFSQITSAPSGAGTRSAPTRLGISGPGLTLSFGVGLLGASAGLSPSWGLTDFEDLNGDGYPDVISAGSVTYTDQLGQYLSSRGVGRTSVTNQDLTISVNGGLSAGMVDIVPSPKGGTNVVDGDAAGKGSSASDAGPSYSLGISGSGGYSWTSPNASGGGGDPSTSTYGEQVSSLESDFGADSSEIQRAFADINGDGLPDSVYTSASGVYAYYNLGYGFTEHAVKLGGGGFESRESASGGAGAGFSLPYGEFGGGVNFLWNYDWSTYSWRDLNGDGILDQFHRISDDDIKVAFGTGSGLLPPVDYGQLYEVAVSPGIDDRHVSFDRSSGVGGGVSATAYIGPLCLVACYLVIGGGGGYNNSRSSSNADLQDVNGDGFADSVGSLNDDLLTVKLNQQRRTNLLERVTNPLGGSFELDYERMGNTVEHPDSIWVMSRVDIDDGRSATGGDYASTFDYEGLAFDRTHRSSLGFDKVTTTEIDPANGDAPLRRNEQTFLNDNVFVTGLLTSATMSEPDGAGWLPVRGSTVDWGVRDVRLIGDDFDAHAQVGTIPAGDLDEAQTVASRGRSIAPLTLSNDEYWYADATTRTFSQRTEYDYDGLGNVLVERDLGAPDDAFDDLTTTVAYSSCNTSATSNGCLAKTSPRQPFWSPGTCVNWASYPTRVTVDGVDAGGASVRLRERVSEVAMCDNGAATVLDELVSNDGGAPTYATTDLAVNAYGDYEWVMAPPRADGTRYTVRYGYDADRHSDIASVQEYDVPVGNVAAVMADGPSASNAAVGVSSSATFDPLSGRVASRTDANGATRSYAYDEHGRIVQTSTMGTPADPATPLITYEYHANDAAYGYAIARHVDTFGGNDPTGTNDAAGIDTTRTIDTITFVDGLGRVRQTKRDARLSVAGAAPVNTRQVTDGVEFDALARPVVRYGPTADPGAATTFSAAATGGKQTVTTWFSYDLPESLTEPGDRVTTYDYPWESIGGSPLMALTVETDPEGRVVTIAQDVRDVQRFHIDQPAPRVDDNGDPVVPPDALLTTYRVNSLGELLQVEDSTGALTSYQYDLVGHTIRATTPNGGTVETTYDLAGNERTMVNDAMAAIGEQTTYGYEFDRLTEIDYPGTVDDVTYEYGLDNSDGRFTAGRIRHLEDRTRLVDNEYDATGALVEQTAIIKRHNWRPTQTGDELDKFTYTTQWSYDQLGRIATVGYPDAKQVSFVPAGTSVGDLTSPDGLTGLLETADLDGELVSYQYDSGGLLQSVAGAEAGIEMVPEQIAPDIDGFVATIQVPRRTTHEYDYLSDRVYDHRLLAIRDEMGNGTVSDYSFDADTRWLESQRTDSSAGKIQDLAYTYDIVGRPLTYTNDLPLANRAINGGAVSQQFSYDGFGRLRAASGTFDIKAGEQERFSYGVEFTPEAPWSVVAKQQRDETVKTKGKPSVMVDDDQTYSFERVLGTAGGPLRAVSDDLTTYGDPTQTYDYVYNVNGAIESMLADSSATPAAAPTNGNGKGNNKPDPAPVPSEPNVWDRQFTWTLMNQMTSADDGSELRTFAYDDTGALMIQDGNLLTRDGDVVAEHGGGPETIFLNSWVTIRSQKIYKHVLDGLDKIVTKMDSGGSYEDKQMYLHTDVVGSTNMVTDNQGRGFQRHEYFPSGEIWINDHKEEIRTPFQFGDGYYEDEFDLILFSARWYDVERELFLSPDPLLSSDPQALIDQPALGGAYTYAGANPVGNVDPSGLQFFSAHQRVAVKARTQEAFEIDQFVLKVTGEGAQAQAKLDKRIKLLKAQERAETVLEPNALIKIDLNEKKVSVGAPYGARKEWALKGGNTGSQSAPPVAANSAATDDASDATNPSGGPNTQGIGAQPGSTTVNVNDVNADAPDDAASSDDPQPSPAPVNQGAAGREDNRGDN